MGIGGLVLIPLCARSEMSRYLLHSGNNCQQMLGVEETFHLATVMFVCHILYSHMHDLCINSHIKLRNLTVTLNDAKIRNFADRTIDLIVKFSHSTRSLQDYDNLKSLGDSELCVITDCTFPNHSP